MSKRILYIAAYDIADPCRLRHALVALKRYATGGQKSVFECFLTDAERAALLREIAAIIDFDEDRFMLLRLATRGATQVLGRAVMPADPDYFYVG